MATIRSSRTSAVSWSAGSTVAVASGPRGAARELWSLISNITKLPTAMLVMTLAILGGVLCTLVAVATEDRPS